VSARRLFAVLIAIMALGASACRGSDEDTTNSDPPGRARPPAPQPSEPIAAATVAFEAGLRTGNCSEFASVALHSRGRPEGVEPGAPPTEDECSALARFSKRVRGYRVVQSRELGTAAVVDGRSRRRPLSSVFVLDQDGRWKHTASSAPGSAPMVGTEPPAGSGFDRSAEAFVRAVRRRDCAGIWRTMAADSPFVTSRLDSRQRLCIDLIGAYRRPGSFFSRVVEDRGAKPVRLGATRANAFYGVSFRDGAFYTLVLRATPGRSENPILDHEDYGLYDYYLGREAG